MPRVWQPLPSRKTRLSRQLVLAGLRGCLAAPATAANRDYLGASSLVPPVVSESLVPILRIDPAVDVLPWYRRLGFSLVSEHTFGPGMPKYLIVQRNGVHLHLSEHEGDAPPRGVAFMWVHDIASIANEFQTHAHAEPWGREVELVDPAGNRLRVCESSDL